MTTVEKGIEPRNFCWRLHIKTGAEEGIDPHDFCIKKGILGMGWSVETDEKSLDWESYLKLGKEQYHDNNGWLPAIRTLYERMCVDELCWTRSDGVYYLGRITGVWSYQNTEKNRQADVVNIRKCEWYLVGKVDSVPGKIVNSFIPSANVQRVNDKSASVYSHYLFNKLRKESFYKLDQMCNDFDLDLFTLISAEDCEDIVGIYLQSQGYRFIPSSCKSHTAGYEFVLKREGSGESAVVQVKQGGPQLDASEYSETFREDKVFLFHTQGNYTGDRQSNVKCLDPEEMKRFALSNRDVLSDRLNNWIDIWQEMTK